VLFLFTSKEDTPFYLAATAVGLWWVKEPGFTRRNWVLLFLSSVAWFLLYNRVLQPRLLAETGVGRPGYLDFWGHHGNSLGEILWHMLTHFWVVLYDIARSRWLHMLGPCLLLPLVSARTVLPIAFGMFFLGSASYDAMYLYGAYYPLPLVAFCLVGVMFFAARTNLTRWAPVISAVALMAFSVIDGKAPRSGLFSFARHDEMKALGARLMAGKRPALIQTVLYPHVGYSTQFSPLWGVDQCFKSDALAVFDLTERTYPMVPDEVIRFITVQTRVGAVEVLPSGTVALVDCQKTVDVSFLPKLQ
jgi:Predicted membrane protein (DUF2079)